MRLWFPKTRFFRHSVPTFLVAISLLFNTSWKGSEKKVCSFEIRIIYSTVYLNNNDIGTVPEDPELVSEIIFLNTADEPVIRFLGLFLDPNLTFKYHIAKVVSKIAKGMFIIRTVKNILPESALKTLYFSLINSHLIYALPAYGCAENSVLKPLVKIQKKQ